MPLIEKIKDFYKKNESLAPAFFFLSGFSLDIFTLGRIDDLSNVLMLSLYQVLSLFTLITYLKKAGVPKHLKGNVRKVFEVFDHYQEEIFHFCQGALLSAFTLFYFKSASLSSSLVFLLFMTSLLLLNELPSFQKRGNLVKGMLINLTFLSFTLVYVPQIFGKVGGLIFFTSLCFYGILLVLYVLVLNKVKIQKSVINKNIIAPGIALIFFFTFMRFFNFMPPVPLSLEMAGIYHKVEKKYPIYELYHERPWWRFWHQSDESFYARPDDTLYFFTRVFAPGGFQDQVIVHWQTYRSGEWKTSDKIPLEIIGGREDGYRGIAYKKNYSPGLWRVSVETLAGLEIGRLNFEVIASNDTTPREFHVVKD